MPKLWNETIAAHQAAVRDATLDGVAALVAEHGLTAVTMSEIAARAGIGRATLYKYFPDVRSVLLAWHERLIGRHLEQLAQVREQSGDGDSALPAVLEAYALMQFDQPDTELAAGLHGGDHVEHAAQHLSEFLRDLIVAGAAAGRLRSDVAPDELANYCLHALAGATGLPSKAAVHRLVALTMAGLRPPVLSQPLT